MSNLKTVIAEVMTMSDADIHAVIDAVKYRRAQLSKMNIRAMGVGDKVQFNGKRGHIVGTVTKVKLKNCTVRDDKTGMLWNVPATMLTAVAVAVAA